MTRPPARPTGWGLRAAAAAAAAVGGVLLLPLAPPDPVPDRLAAGGGGGAGSNSATPATEASPPASPSATPQADRSPLHQPAADLQQQWRPVAAGFARDFTTPGAGHADWATRIRRWTSSYLAEKYQHTDRDRIPAAGLLDVTPIAVGETAVTFHAEYDTGLRLVGRAELGPTGWQITAARPATTTSGS